MRASLEKFLVAVSEAESDQDREQLVEEIRKEVDKLRDGGSAGKRYLLLSLKDHLISMRRGES